MTTTEPLTHNHRETLRKMPTRERWNALASTIAMRRREIAELKADLDYAQAWLLEEMNAQDPPAVEVNLDDWNVRQKTSQSYDYDEEGLSELQGYLTPAEWDQLGEQVSYRKWSKTALNKLHRAGGVLAQIIDRGVQVTSKRTELELRPRPR